MTNVKRCDECGEIFHELDYVLTYHGRTLEFHGIDCLYAHTFKVMRDRGVPPTRWCYMRSWEDELNYLKSIRKDVDALIEKYEQYEKQAKEDKGEKK